MALIKMISEEAAEGTVRSIYDKIKQTLGIDFVPNMYRVMALKPDLLRSNWEKIKSIMQNAGKLDAMTREIIAITVSSMIGCNY